MARSGGEAGVQGFNGNLTDFSRGDWENTGKIRLLLGEIGAKVGKSVILLEIWVAFVGFSTENCSFIQ